MNLDAYVYGVLFGYRSAIPQWDDHDCVVQLALSNQNQIKHNDGSTVWVKCMALSGPAGKQEGSLQAAVQGWAGELRRAVDSLCDQTVSVILKGLFLCGKPLC